MSRIFEALQRASAPATDVQSTEADPTVPRSLLDPIDPLSRSSVAAPRTSARQLAPLHPEFERKLIVNDRLAPVAIEQYRRLAASLHELQADKGLRTLMVTSAVPGEGKTLTVANLALTLSEAFHRRVLLVDADLRRPFVHELFRLPNEVGLSDVLRSDRVETPLLEVSERLTVLTAGHVRQSVAALTTDRIRVLLEQSAKAFEWVLLDAPPIGVMPEAQLLARLTRAVLFVIAANSTPHPLVSRAIAELQPEWIVGTILNRAEPHQIPAADYYNGYYRLDRPARPFGAFHEGRREA